MATWKCNKCGNMVSLLEPPEVCPSCNDKCQFIDVSCYIPQCGGAGSGNIDQQVYQESYKADRK